MIQLPLWKHSTLLWNQLYEAGEDFHPMIICILLLHHIQHIAVLVILFPFPEILWRITEWVHFTYSVLSCPALFQILLFLHYFYFIFIFLILFLFSISYLLNAVLSNSTLSLWCSLIAVLHIHMIPFINLIFSHHEFPLHLFFLFFPLPNLSILRSQLMPAWPHPP